MTTLQAVEHDVGKLFTDTLLIGEAVPDFTNAVVWCQFSGPAGVKEGQGTIVDAAVGKVSYETKAGDLPVWGIYRQKWELRYPNGDVMSFPDGDFNWLAVLPDVDAPTP